jgi:hypothetical protein
VRVSNRIASLAAVALLAGCLSNTGDPQPAPSGVQAVVGDGIAGITWNTQPGVSYLAFGSNNSNLTTLNWLDPGIGGFPMNNLGTSALPPTQLCSAINGADYYFTVDAFTGTSPGGPGSPVVKATPRSAGGGGNWTLGTPIGANVNAVTYAGITGCSSRGSPTGLFVAVGPAGAIYSSPDGKTWTARTPAGYTTDLYGVAAYTAATSTPAAPAFVFVAVGAGGATLTSTNGTTWTVGVATNASAPALRSVALAGQTFVAAGDGGRIQISLDGINWTVETSNTTVNLHAVQCSFVSISYACVAVGDAGVIDASVDGGATWTPLTVGGGAAALRAVAYGNFDNNLTAPGVVGVAGVININTWIAVGDAGSVFVDSTGNWTAVPLAGAPNLAALGYTTQFVALDAAGNVYTSQTGATGTWSATAATGLATAAGITTNLHGYLAVGSAGDNATSF